jgi:hypothetical protein
MFLMNDAKLMRKNRASFDLHQKVKLAQKSWNNLVFDLGQKRVALITISLFQNFESRKMKQAILTSTLFIIIGIQAKSQNQNSLINRIHIGGNFTFNYGKFYDVFEVAPNIGYYFTNQLVVGAGVSYSRFGYEYEFQDEWYKSSDKYNGVSIFARYYLHQNPTEFLNNVYFQAEYEILKSRLNSEAQTSDKKEYAHQLPMVGIGYRQHIAGRFALTASLAFVLKNKDHSPYRNPIVRVGFNF